MNHHNRRKLASMRRVKQFLIDHPFLLTNAAAAAEHSALSGVVLRMEAVAGMQLTGMGTRSGAVAERLSIERRLRDLMGGLARAAKVLDPTVFPDVAEKMRMSGIDSFEELLTRANVFRSTILPIQADFIALGALSTVVADLDILIDALKNAGNRKWSGLDIQIAATKGIEVSARKGMQHIRKLDAIISLVCRLDPVLLAQWKAAKRVERPGTPEGEPLEATHKTSAQSEEMADRAPFENHSGVDGAIGSVSPPIPSAIPISGRASGQMASFFQDGLRPLYNRQFAGANFGSPVTISPAVAKEGLFWRLSS